MDERVRLPKVLVCLLWAYMGIMGVVILTEADMGDNNWSVFFWSCNLFIFTAAATYGTISFYEDLKKYGIKYVAEKIGLVYLIRKIKRLLNK